MDFASENELLYSKKPIFWRDASYFREDCQIIPEITPPLKAPKGKYAGHVKPLLLAAKVFDEALSCYENRSHPVKTQDSDEEICSETLERKRVFFAQEFVKLTEKCFGKEETSTSSAAQKISLFESNKRKDNLPHIPKKAENSPLHRDFVNSRYKKRKNRAVFFRERLRSGKTPQALQSSKKNLELGDCMPLPNSSKVKYEIPPRFARSTGSTQQSSDSSSKSSKLDYSKPQMSSNVKNEIPPRKPPVKAILDILEIDYPEKNAPRLAVQPDSNVSDFLCIEVSSGEQFCKDIPLLPEKLLRLKRDFPKLTRLIPEPNGKFQVEYRAEIVWEFLRYMCGGRSSNWTQLIPNWRTAVEMMSLTKTYQLKHLHMSIATYFNEGLLSEENAADMFVLSHHFQVPEVVSLCKKFLLEEMGYSITELENDAVDLKKTRKTCVVSTLFHQEPVAFVFPLHQIEQNFASVFPKDVENKIKFESIDGHYEITGIQLKFQPTDKDVELEIFCDLANGSEGVKWEEHRVKKLDSVLIINFEKKLSVKPGQTAVINITIEDLQPRFSYSGKETQMEGKSLGTFVVTITSNLKLHADYKMFFVEKILYIAKK